jgi:hypothetical protein
MSTYQNILSPAQLRHLECINQAWAKSLAGWRDSVEGIIATGKALTTAQTELQGDFDALLKEPQFPFGQRMVQMLRKIADHPVLSDETCFASLPPSWGTLHALSQLPDKVIKKALTDGTVNPKMERKDIIKLMPPKKCAAAGCNKPVHKDGYCNQHYVAPEPLTAHDLIVQVLERHKVELRADPDQTRKLVEWLVENVEEGQRETLFKPLADLLPIDREADDSSSNQADDTIIIQLPASPEPSPEPLFENPEDEPAPPEAPADDGLDMPEFLDRKKEIRAVLLKQRPYLRETPEKLEAEVLARIR